MTYKESLNIAFLKTDSEASDYDSGLFPVLANEAQMYIAKYGTHIIRKKEYEVTALPFTDNLPPDFYRTAPLGLVRKEDSQTGVEYYIGEDSVVNDDGTVEPKNIINIEETGNFILYYWALPNDLTAEGVDLAKYEYEVAPHTHVAIPAYIGYQLVKTDDTQLAQILLNEWNKYLSLFDDKTKAVKRKIRSSVRWW